MAVRRVVRLAVQNRPGPRAPAANPAAPVAVRLLAVPVVVAPRVPRALEASRPAQIGIRPLAVPAMAAPRAARPATAISGVSLPLLGGRAPVGLALNPVHLGRNRAAEQAANPRIRSLAVQARPGRANASSCERQVRVEVNLPKWIRDEVIRTAPKDRRDAILALPTEAADSFADARYQVARERLLRAKAMTSRSETGS